MCSKKRYPFLYTREFLNQRMEEYVLVFFKKINVARINPGYCGVDVFESV